MFGATITRIEPTPRTETVRDLFANDTLPKRGDYVFAIKLQDDRAGGSVVVTPPGSGRLRDVDVNVEHRSITLTFDFGMRITASGDATVKWYPEEPE